MYVLTRLRLINQAGEPKVDRLPFLKAFESSSLVLDIEDTRRDLSLSDKNSLLNGCSRANDKYSRHCAYGGSGTKERPFIKRLGSVALPGDLNGCELQNKRVKIEFITKPTFRAPTLTGSWHADKNNDKRLEAEVNSQMELLTMTSEVDFYKKLKDTPQGQYFLIDKANSIRGYNQNNGDLAKFGLANQGTGQII